MKKISVVTHSGYGHINNQANGIGSDIETAKAFGARVTTVVPELVR